MTTPTPPATRPPAAEEPAGLETLGLPADPVRRAIRLVFLILLQVMSLLLLLDEPDEQKRRAHPVLAPTSLLSRFDAGETFDLPAPLITWVRWATQRIRHRIVRTLRRHAPIAPQAPAAAPTRPRHQVAAQPPRPTAAPNRRAQPPPRIAAPPPGVTADQLAKNRKISEPPTASPRPYRYGVVMISTWRGASSRPAQRLARN